MAPRPRLSERCRTYAQQVHFPQRCFTGGLDGLVLSSSKLKGFRV